MESSAELRQAAAYLVYGLAAGAAMFVLFAIAMTVLARKMRVPGAWMAWIPGLNLFLICRLADLSYLFVLLFLVPLVNLLCAAYAGARIAGRRGRPAILGVLLPIPVLGLLALFAMASGPEASGPTLQARPQPAAAPSVCPECGSPECVGEDFCGNTGRRIGPWPAPAAPAPRPAAAASAAPSGGSKALAAVLGLLLVVGAGFLLMGVLTSGRKVSPPGVPGQFAALPQRMAGALREFPVDTDHTHAARPSGLVSQTFSRHGNAPVKVPAAKLPPWVPPQELPRISAGVAEADYRVAPQDLPISVAVLETLPGEPPAAALSPGNVRAALPDAQVTGVEVRRPDGARYSGIKVRSVRGVYYVLQKAGESLLILISASNGAPSEVAGRLAAGVGDGQGLLDYPEMDEALTVLPPPPPGLELIEARTFGAAELNAPVEQVRSALGPDAPAGAITLVKRAQVLIPDLLTLAQYGGGGRQPLNVAIGSYGSGMSAWVAWQTLHMLSLGSLKSGELPSGACYFVDQGATSAVLLRRGRYLALVAAEGARSRERAASLAETVGIAGR
jgi:hypothetical protein